MKIILFLCLCYVPIGFSLDHLILLQLIKQTGLMTRELSSLQSSLKEQVQIKKDMEGRYHYGEWGESEAEFSKRTWSPADWAHAIDHQDHAGSAHYDALYKAYDSHHHALSKNQYALGASDALANSYDALLKTNRATSTAADYEYELIQSHLSHVHALTKKIEEAPNTKSAIDLNSRLLAELSYISVEELRMQTLMNHQFSASAYQEIAARDRESMFNRLPKEDH